MEKLKVGVVGCGLIAKLRHIPAYKRMRNVEVRAVCDLDESLAREIADEFKVPKYYTDSSKMFSEGDLDIVDICVPPQIHAPIAVDAMENGIHVIMEKPMALKTSDCEDMIKASKKNNVKLSVIHNVLFHPPFIKAKEMVNKGEIGDFIGMRTFLSTPRWDMIDLEEHWYHKLPGGVIGETGPHMAYTSLEFLNDINKVDVFARNSLNHPWAPNDEFRIEMDGEKGFSSVVLSYTGNNWVSQFQIIGTEGTLNLDLHSMLVTKQFLHDLSYGPITKYSLGSIGQRVGGLISNGFKVLIGKQQIGTEIVIEKYIDSILNDSDVPISAEKGKNAVNLMERVVENYRGKYGVE